jgi:HPr kinase/phosphorylase
VSVPVVTMPVAPGRNIAMLVEVAARNQILRTRGRHAARLLADRLERRLEAMADRTAEGPEVIEDEEDEIV